MFDKSLNEYTLKELQEIEYQDYDGTSITDIIVVPVNKRHASKYRCMKYILFSSSGNHISGVLGGTSDIMQFNRTYSARTIRIDCLYRSKCLRFMISPSFILYDLPTIIVNEFHI